MNNAVTIQKPARQSGIELLRILTACAVVMLHYNDGKALTYATGGGTKQHYMYWKVLASVQLTYLS